MIVSNPEFKFKKMGLIGTLKIVSHLSSANDTSCSSSSQKSNYEEALELLKTSLDLCQQLPISLILFYDELSAMLDSRTLHPAIMEWVGQHVGEFESMFLSDLESGKLPVSDLYCGIEGELWMNLDGDISPICLNILPLASSSLRPTSLQILPANFRLLSVIERLGNQGSLGGIDALLGCPLHLPASKLFLESAWQSLNRKQKLVVCASLYYAINWIRELLNAFGTQVAGSFDCISQATKEEIISKMLKRLRNLVFLESLLNNSLKDGPLSLPELNPHAELPSASFLGQPNYVAHVQRNSEKMKSNQDSSQSSKKKDKKVLKTSKNSSSQGNTTQLTIMDAWRKAGAIPSQDISTENSTGMPTRSSPSQAAGNCANDSSQSVDIEISEAVKLLDSQRYKFRPLLIDCFSILTYSQNLDSCCADPTGELPVYLYLLRDLHSKLEYFSPKPTPGRFLSTLPGLSGITAIEFVSKIRTLFPTLKRHLDSAISLLEPGSETCQAHWKDQSTMAGNPEISNMVVSISSVSNSVVKVTLHCFSKMLNFPDILGEKLVLLDLLNSFQPEKVPDSFFAGMKSLSSSGDIYYLYAGAYAFLEGVLDIALSSSFLLASEVVLALESVVLSLQKFLSKPPEGTSKHTQVDVEELLTTLTKRLGSSAEKLLRHNWHNGILENGWKGKGEMVQKMVHLYLENWKSAFDMMDELACSILPTVSSSRHIAEEEHNHGFTTLCSTTFIVWYKELHERNLATLNGLVKEAVQINKSRAGSQSQDVQILLKKFQQSINVVVSLINICRTHDKVTVRAMAVKYGGKYVDSFLKAFEFLQAHFQGHNELIVQLVKEFQKGTRTIQTLCSEAKGLKQTAITSKIPATKRSLERFLFRVKALLHTSSSGRTFWMGNLKHKNLMGEVVSSQAYIDDIDENHGEDFGETVAEDQILRDASDEDRVAE